MILIPNLVAFLPEALLAYGYCHRLCVCVYVSVCLSTFACPDDNSSHVPARITWFGRKDAKHFALGPYCFGGLLRSTFQVKFNFFLKFCLFASLLRLWNICETCKNGVCWTVPHRTWCRTHSDSFICTPTGSCHGPWNSLINIFVRASQSCQPSTRRLAVDFTSCCRFSPNYTHLTCWYLILQHRQSPKQL